MQRILFVCNDNQAYSPAAEAILKKYIRDHGVTGNFEVDSAGVKTIEEGGFPNLDIMKRASDSGYLITHRIRKFSSMDIDRHNYIIVIGTRLFNDLFSQVKDDDTRIKLFPAQDFLTQKTYEDFANKPFDSLQVDLVISALEDICSGLWKYIVEECTYMEDS